MKQLFVIVSILLLTACGNNEQQAAEKLLDEARMHYMQGDLNAARAGIDSLRKTYPQMVEIRKGALKLHQEVELKAAQQDVERLDQELQKVNVEYEKMKKASEAAHAAGTATAEQLTNVTLMRMHRDSLQTQFDVQCAKIKYIKKRQQEK